MNIFHDADKRKRLYWLKMPLHVYLSYLLVATFLFTGVSFSKYASTASGRSGARVAAFSVSASGEASAALVLEVLSEEQVSDSYSFTVTGNSEVAVRDIVTVTLPEMLPNGITMTMTVNSVEVSPETDGRVYKFSRDLAFGADQHLWTLSFTADPGALEITETFELDGISIYVDAIQIN